MAIERIRSFDIDGVIAVGEGSKLLLLKPDPQDVIITGRSYEERWDTLGWLRDNGIHNKVFFNPVKFKEKTRVSSADHKVKTIIWLNSMGMDIWCHFEDDEVQKKVIEEAYPFIRVIHVVHNMTEKENVRFKYER